MSSNLFFKKCKFCCCFVLFVSVAEAQVKDSLYNLRFKQADNTSFHFRSTYIPAAFIALGAYSNTEETFINNEAIKSERNERLPYFRTQVDDYLQYAPIIAGYGFAVTKSPNRLWIYTKEVFVNEIIISLSVRYVKHWSKVPSIANGSYNAFPSGHTAQAFSAATLFNDNFAQGNLWLQGASYATASTVGVLRILNNKHWVSDVVAGAGFGILSAKLSELITKRISSNKSRKIIYIP